MMRYRFLMSAGLACAAMTACHGKPGAQETASAGDAPTLCIVADWQQDAVAAKCSAGQPVAFLPERFGNEQLPIMFAALNCDLDRPTVQTSGGVACTYRPAKVKREQPTDQSTTR